MVQWITKLTFQNILRLLSHRSNHFSEQQEKKNGLEANILSTSEPQQKLLLTNKVQTLFIYYYLLFQTRERE